MLWSISEKNHIMELVAKEREDVGADLFKISDKYFTDTAVNFRAISAVNVTALYYLALHSTADNGTFCGIDLSTEEGRKETTKAVKLINRLVFDHAAKQDN